MFSKVVRSENTWPTNGSRSEKVWEPLSYAVSDSLTSFACDNCRFSERKRPLQSALVRVEKHRLWGRDVTVVAAIPQVVDIQNRVSVGLLQLV